MTASTSAKHSFHKGSQGTLFLNGVETGSDIQITGSETRGIGFIAFKTPPLDSLAIHLEVRPSLSSSSTKVTQSAPLSFQFVHKGMRVRKDSNKPMFEERPNIKTSKSMGQLKKRPSLPSREETLQSAISARSAPTPVVSTTRYRSRTLSALNGNLVVSGPNTPVHSRPSTRTSHNRDRSRSIGSQPKSSSESHQSGRIPNHHHHQQHPPLPPALVKRVSSERALHASPSVPSIDSRVARVSRRLNDEHSILFHY